LLIASQAQLSPSSSFLHLLPILSLTFCYCSEEWDWQFPMTMMRLGIGKHILITLFSVFSLLIDIEAAQPKQPACEPGVCSRRLMQYMYHQRHRPSDNDIGFWREFVSEYFAPHAKKRWCVSLYGSSGRQPTGVFPQDVWQCEICGSKPGRGFGKTKNTCTFSYCFCFHS
jgi:hypothetical protein